MPTMVAGAAVDQPRSAEVVGGQGRSRTWRFPLSALAIAAGGVSTVWPAAAVIASGHGLDITDEGFYLLSYRWWHSNPWNFTGAQYLYGPIFQALGHNIAALRLVRLALVVSSYLIFGWTFMRWLRLRRPAAPASRLWEVTGVFAIVTAGGLIYGWLPNSPGYNDVVLLGSLLTMAVICRAAMCVDRGRPVPAWLPAVAGAVAVTMLMTKWSSAALLVLSVATLMVASRARGVRQVARLIGWWIAGAGLAAGLVHLLIVPLTVAIPRLATVNWWIANGPFKFSAVLRFYAETAMGEGLRIGIRHGLLFVAVVVAVSSRRPVAVRTAAALSTVAVGVSAWRLVSEGGLFGGTGSMPWYLDFPLAALASALLTAGLVLRGRSSSLCGQPLRDWAILAMLAVLPVAQALGTTNPILYGAINAFAAWMAVIIAVLTGIQAAPVVARRLIAVVTVFTVVAAASIATGGLLINPYRTTKYAVATSAVPGVPALASIKLDPATAAGYRGLYDRLQPWVQPRGRAMIAFDELSGIVFFLGGRPVGEAWTGVGDPYRAATAIAAECAQGTRWWGDRPPILLFNRPVQDNEIGALKACGYDFAADYRLLAPAGETMGLSVYIPYIPD